MQSTKLAALAIAVALTLSAGQAAAQQPYPSKVIRIVTAQTGGTHDFGARLLSQGLAPQLGQSVIVDNRGLLAAEVVAKSPADGYALLYYGSPFWLAPFLRDKVSWDPLKDFVPVSLSDRAPVLLVVHPSLPVKSVKELIALAKAKPGELNYARASVGSSTHLTAELFKSMTKTNIVSIPFKGGGPALIGVLTGQAQLTFSPAGSVMPYVKSGKMRALALTSAAPSALFPGLPTIAASGLPGYEAETIVGVFAPAGTPPAIVERLSREIAQTLKKPEIHDRFASLGMETVGSSPEQLGAAVRQEMTKWSRIIKDAGIRDE